MGFTLLELLVVLAIGSLLVALVPPAFDRLREISQYRDTVRAIVVDLRQARQQALSYGQTVNFHIDLSDRTFGIEGAAFKALPISLEVKTTVGSQEQLDNAQPSIFAFLPEGGSSGGTIELVRPSGAGVRIRVDWLFGQITQEARTQ
jgi:general secretion pathway protein H